MTDRDSSGASRLRVALWLPSAQSAPPGDPADPAGPVPADDGPAVDGPDVAVTAILEPTPPDRPAEAESLLRPVQLDRAYRRRGRWWFVLVPAVVIALVVAVALQLQSGPAPWRPPLPEMTPQVVLPQLTPPPSAGGGTGSPTGSASASASRRTASTPGGTATGGPGAGPGGTGTATTGPGVAGGAQPGSIVGSDGRCLEPEDAAPFSDVRLVTCTPVAEQQWSAPGDGTVRTQGYCLDVTFGRRSSGSPVALNFCNGGGSQRWELGANGWRNPQSNRCLTASSTRLTIEDCTGAANQRLSLT